MPQYLVAVHHPKSYDPALMEDEAMHHDIDVLNEEMIAAGIRVFVGGLQPPETARSLRPQPGGEVTVSPGTYLEGSDCVCGFWVLEIADLDEALEWGRKAALACRAAVEVRPFHQMPES